jgi:hypothetical protein
VSEGKCYPLLRKDGSFFFASALGGIYMVEYCVGAGTVQRGLDPTDFLRSLDLPPGRFVLDVYGAQLIDTRAEGHGRMGEPLSFVTQTAASGVTAQRQLREVRAIRDDSGNLTSFIWHIPGMKGSSFLRVHRLLQVVFANLKLSPTHDPILLEFSGGTTLEIALGRPDKAASKSKHAHLAASNALATVCDVDHRLGRDHLWQNGVWYTRAVSHGHNSALGWTRKKAGDWLFGLADCPYTCGQY